MSLSLFMPPIGFDKRLRRLLNRTSLHLDEQDMPQRRDNHQVQLPKVLIALVHGRPRQVMKDVEVSGKAVAQDLEDVPLAVVAGG